MKEELEKLLKEAQKEQDRYIGLRNNTDNSQNYKVYDAKQAVYSTFIHKLVFIIDAFPTSMYEAGRAQGFEDAATEIIASPFQDKYTLSPLLQNKAKEIRERNK